MDSDPTLKGDSVTKPTQILTQSTFSQEMVNRVKELFGENSVEHGLAISGSHDLTRWVEEQYRRVFSFDEILIVADSADGSEGIITLAKWHKEVSELLVDLHNATDGTKNFRFWFNKSHPKDSD